MSEATYPMSVNDYVHTELLDRLQRAIDNNAIIEHIYAYDAADSDRAIHYKFTPEQSKAIFEIAKRALASDL